MSKLNSNSFTKKAQFILYFAQRYSRQIGCIDVNVVTLLSAIAWLGCGAGENEFAKFFVKSGVSQDKLKTSVHALQKKYAKELTKEYNSIAIEITEMDSSISNWKIKYIYIEAELYSHIEDYQSFKIADSGDDKGTQLTELDLLNVIIQNYNTMYEYFMNLCVPTTALVPQFNRNVNRLPFAIPDSLKSFLSVMNDEFSPEETLCPILGRDKETEKLQKIMSKYKKRNAILVGEPGVGKTALVEKLAWQITTGNCNEKFRYDKIVKLDVSGIIAGTQYRGTAEERFQQLIDFLDSNEEVILFIDEIHTILGAGACREGEMDLANSLKPILARGKTRVIGATTKAEYYKYFASDGALSRRFEMITVNEPKSSEVYPMIKNQIKLLERHHNVTISKRAVNMAILYAACFKNQTRNPDRTLDVIDTSMASAELAGRNKVTKADILSNFEIMIELYKNSQESDRKAVAFHEAGHYILNKYSRRLGFKVLAVSIMPAEDYCGVNVFEIDNRESPTFDYEFYIQSIAMSLAGRIAEYGFTGRLSAGAQKDLKEANETAEKMVTQFGVNSNEIEENFRVYTENSQTYRHEALAKKLNEKVEDILVQARNFAVETLNEHKDELEILVNLLMERGIVTEKEIQKTLNKK